MGHAVGRDRLHDPDTRANDGMGANACVAAEDRSVGVDGDMVLDVGMAFDAFDRIARGIDLERFRSEGDALVDLDVSPDPRGFADDDAGAVVDEEVRPDLRARMNVG